MCIAGFHLSLVNAATIVTTLEVPEAYESFNIEALSDILTSFPEGYYLEITQETLAIAYNRIAGGILGPGMPLIIHIPGLPSGTYDIEVLDISNNIESGAMLTVADAPPIQPVYAFFFPGVHHYFITADDEERDKELACDWKVADPGFNAWPADGPAPDAALPVCRFYAGLMNSHFYTASEDECDYLLSFDSGWEYEGIAFRALVSTAGACPAGTAPVWRLYNDRAAQKGCRAVLYDGH